VHINGELKCVAKDFGVQDGSVLYGLDGREV
jgi:hypothetical protein